MERNIFKPRENYKPFEYPEVIQFTDRINQTFWTHSEVEFTADIQDFHTALNSVEKEAIVRALLGIAQTEVAVKSFWGDLYKSFPKPEFNVLGATFAHNEAIHSEAYSRLLEVLGLEERFNSLLDTPIFKQRFELCKKHLTESQSVLEKLLFFTLVVENASLFSQFATILSFTRFKGLMKNTSNIIAWTSADEDCHKDAGIYLINKIQEERSTLLGKDEHSNDLFTLFIKEYMELEEKLIDWLFEEGELEFFTKKNLLDFMKYRVDNALAQIGIEKIYNISEEDIKPMLWFEEEIYANSLDDFFAKRPVDYTKHDKSITSKDLF